MRGAEQRRSVYRARGGVNGENLTAGTTPDGDPALLAATPQEKKGAENLSM